MSVLIVDDNPALRGLMRSMIGDLTNAVYECGDGSQALALYETHRPDWVLMDLQMKEMDGLTATRQILARNPGARIVMVTQHSSPALRAEAASAGVVGFVVKADLISLRGLLSGHPL
jgi:CheY-like chemotaxis protein